MGRGIVLQIMHDQRRCLKAASALWARQAVGDADLDERLPGDTQSTRFLIDPYAREIAGDPSVQTAKCVVQPEGPGWAEDERPRTPTAHTIFYEVHVKGFTAHPSSKANAAGTFRGVVEKIPHLKELGVTAGGEASNYENLC